MMKFYTLKVGSYKGRKKYVHGSHLARRPQFADPCSRRIMSSLHLDPKYTTGRDRQFVSDHNNNWLLELNGKIH